VLSFSKVLLLPVSYQVQSDLLMDEPQRVFERHMTGLGLAHLDLLLLLREKNQRDSVNVFYDYCHDRPVSYEYFAKTETDFPLREVISS
jgi:hypothetical protein